MAVAPPAEGGGLVAECCPAGDESLVDGGSQAHRGRLDDNGSAAHGSCPAGDDHLADRNDSANRNNLADRDDLAGGDNPANFRALADDDNAASFRALAGGDSPADARNVPDGDNPGAAAFFRDAMAAFATAWHRQAAGQLWLRIARRTVLLCFAGARTAEAIAPAFGHLESAPQQTADLTILLWDTASTGVDPPAIPWRPEALDRIGKVQGGCDARFTTVHEPDTGQLWMFDRQSATAVVWMNDVDAVPLWDRIHPFRRLLHEWARGFGADLVHAGAVGIDGVGVLVVGPGGTGKSTTVLAAMQVGLLSAGDDYVLVDTGSSPGSPPAAHALYGAMRLHQTHLERFPALMARHDHVFQEPWSGRAKITSYMSRHRPDRLTAELRLVAIVIPQVVADAREAARETSARALLALAPSSMLQVDPTDGAMFPRLTRLCRALPCWRLPLGPDLTQVGVMLRRLLRSYAP